MCARDQILTDVEGALSGLPDDDRALGLDVATEVVRLVASSLRGEEIDGELLALRGLATDLSGSARLRLLPVVMSGLGRIGRRVLEAGLPRA